MERQRKQMNKDERRRSSKHDKDGLHQSTKEEFDELLGFLKRPSSRKLCVPREARAAAIPSDPRESLGWFHSQLRECCVV